MPRSGITQSAFVADEKLELARRMRKLSTPAEEKAWGLIRNRRCLGLKFRRQQVVLGLIVDFYCAEKRLAVELDGDSHLNRIDYDMARDATLAEAGVQVLRIPNRDVDQLVDLVETVLRRQ